MRQTSSPEKPASTQKQQTSTVVEQKQVSSAPLVPLSATPANMEAERFAAREAEELRREREEAELRQKEIEAAAAAGQKREVDAIVPALQALRRLHQHDPDGLASCLQMLRTYINNLAKNPQEPKFQRINGQNAHFQSKVAPFEGAVAVLEACGFEAQGSNFVVGTDFLKHKGPKLWDALSKVDFMFDQVKRSS